MAHVIHNIVKLGLENVEKIYDLHSKMRKIVHYCHKSPETLALIKGNAKWLGLPDLTLTSECPTRWNSFLDCGERLLKVHTPLNVALVGKPDLMLDKMDILLLEDVIQELREFRNITNMLCSNTNFTFNNLWPMKEYIEDMLNKEVDMQTTNQYKIIKDFRQVMLNHFKKLHLSEKTTRMAKTAAMLDPKHMRLSYQSEVDEFIEHIVQIVSADNTIGKEPETQMIGPSQPPVSLNVNIPKTQEKNNNDDSARNAKKHEYENFFIPKFKMSKKK